MYPQKFEKYFGGELIGSGNGELDKGIFCYMIEGMKESIPCDQVISRKNDAVWLRDELSECKMPRSNRSGTNFYFTF